MIKRWVLHLFILLQLIVVVLSPNPGNILTEALSPIYLGYASTLGFTQTWKFFAPEPGNARVAMVDLIQAGDTLEQIQLPPDNKKGVYWDENYKRISAFFALTTITFERIEKFIKPWLCRSYPDIDSFTINIRELPIENIVKAKIDFAGSRAELTKTHDWPATNFDCERNP